MLVGHSQVNRPTKIFYKHHNIIFYIFICMIVSNVMAIFGEVLLIIEVFLVVKLPEEGV